MSRHPKPPQRAERASTAPAAKGAKAPKLPPAALETVELAKDYGDRPALEPLTVRIEPSQQVAMIGHNGSGKTTFMRLCAGLLQPSGGSASVFGQPAGSSTARRSLSYVSDTPTFYEDLSVWEHLEYVARMHGVEDWAQHAADLLGLLGLYDRADELPNRFSRGLRQKAALALAFVRPFEVLLVDEPFVGLDAGGKEALLELFAGAAESGAALVVATHELSFIDRTERLIALRDGLLVHDGPPTDADARALVSDGRDGTSADEHPADDHETDAVD